MHPYPYIHKNLRIHLYLHMGDSHFGFRLKQGNKDQNPRWTLHFTILVNDAKSFSKSVVNLPSFSVGPRAKPRQTNLRTQLSFCSSVVVREIVG